MQCLCCGGGGDGGRGGEGEPAARLRRGVMDASWQGNGWHSGEVLRLSLCPAPLYHPEKNAALCLAEVDTLPLNRLLHQRVSHPICGRRKIARLSLV